MVIEKEANRLNCIRVGFFRLRLQIYVYTLHIILHVVSPLPFVCKSINGAFMPFQLLASHFFTRHRIV